MCLNAIHEHMVIARFLASSHNYLTTQEQCGTRGTVTRGPEDQESSFHKTEWTPTAEMDIWFSIIHTGFNQRLLRSDDSNFEAITLQATEIPLRILEKLQLWAETFILKSHKCT